MPARTRSHTDQLVSGLVEDVAERTPRRSPATPIYRQIADSVARRVAQMDLPSGTRLPPERELAAALRVSRATVVTAYRDLEARGLVRGFVGRGTFVAAQGDGGTPFAWRGKIAAAALDARDSTLRDLMAHASTPGLISLAAGTPALDLFPATAFRDAADQVLTQHPAMVWGHAPTEGHAIVREVLAHRFGGDPSEVFVIGGAQQGLDLLARCLVDRGDAVIVDRPGYLGALQSLRSAGARMFGWDILGADPDELEDLFLRHRPKLLYTNPTFQNPTGTTLSLRARREIVELAQRYRVPIIEDETYRELSFGAETPPALYELDEGREVVIRVSSFSKVLAPGLRLGWINAVRPIVEQLSLMKQQSEPHTNNLAQLTVARLIEKGVFNRHLATLRTEHRRRRDSVVKALARYAPPGALRVTVPAGGLFLWCRLAPQVDAATVQQLALRRNVSLVTGTPFYADGGGSREMRLCFAANAPDVAAQAARIVAESVVAAARADGSSPVVRLV